MVSTMNGSRPKYAMYQTKCPRCGKSIEKGDPIESWTNPSGKVVWPHVGCQEQRFTTQQMAGFKAAAARKKNAGAASEEVLATLKAEMALLEQRLTSTSGLQNPADQAVIESAVKEAIDKAEQSLAIAVKDAVQADIDQTVNAAVKDLRAKVSELDKARKVEIVIKAAGKKNVVLDEILHPIFEQVRWHLEDGENVMLVGPKGCGKTMLSKHLAKSLGVRHGLLPFSGGVTEVRLFGRVTPNVTAGKSVYESAPFADFYENGGLYLLDELDNGDPNVLVSLNAPLENGKLPIPRPGSHEAKRSKTFYCMAATNTWGNGADRRYCARNAQDSALIERFTQIAMDYDEDFELRLTPGTEDFTRKVQQYRRNVNAARMERELSTRWICKCHRWLLRGKDEGYCESLMFGGWRTDEISRAKGGY